MPRVFAAIDLQVDEMRRRDKETAARHKNAVHEKRPAMQEGDAKQQQYQSWRGEHQWQATAMAAKARDQGDARQNARESDESRFEAMVGEKGQPDNGQQCDGERQGRAVDRTQERGRRTKTIGGVPPAAGDFGIGGGIGHGGHSVTFCTGRGK